MPRVTVVIPTFDRSQTILDSVNSVLRQSFTDFELIVVDDCSTDDTLSVLDRIEDRRLRVVTHTANRGAGGARNTGIDNAKGALVAFQDSDDEWLPSKLEKQVLALDAKGDDWIAVYCGLLVVRDLRQDGDDRFRPRYIPDPRISPVSGHISSSLLRGSFVSTQTLIVRRAALDRVGRFDETLSALEDWDFALRLARTGKIALVDEPLVFQRFSHNSISRSEENRVYSYLQIHNKMKQDANLPNGVFSYHAYRISGGLRTIGRYTESLSYIGRCIRLEPFNLKYYATAIYILIISAINMIRTNTLHHMSK
jgi:glycosyltransferase involved in cell wall biosynthesis